ncbi:unnamed protein product, partial [Choristocarpus tenellus]
MPSPPPLPFPNPQVVETTAVLTMYFTNCPTINSPCHSISFHTPGHGLPWSVNCRADAGGHSCFCFCIISSRRTDFLYHLLFVFISIVVVSSGGNECPLPSEQRGPSPWDDFISLAPRAPLFQ